MFNSFNNFDNNLDQKAFNNPEETKKFMTALIDKALSGKHSEREFIGNFAELSVARTMREATRKIAFGFEEAAKEAYYAYLNNLKNNIDDLSLILNHITYKKCAEFYAAEADLADDEIDEYYYYVFFSGHFIDTVILGLDRPSWHYFDSRNVQEFGDKNE